MVAGRTSPNSLYDEGIASMEGGGSLQPDRRRRLFADPGPAGPRARAGDAAEVLIRALRSCSPSESRQGPRASGSSRRLGSRISGAVAYARTDIRGSKRRRTRSSAMKVLVIGNGGREHALAWKIAASPRGSRLRRARATRAPSVEAENVDIAADDIAGLIKFVQQNSIELTVVGPEAPLVAGIVDVFQREKLRIFGPRKRRRSSKGARSFARTCCTGPTCRRPTTASFAIRTARRGM